MSDDGTLTELRPAPLTRLDEAFPANATPWMPPWESIPEEFKRGHTVYNDFFRRWFGIGWDAVKEAEFEPTEGIDPEKAMRHLHCVMRSFSHRHEYKEAAFAYLASVWLKNLKLPEPSPGSSR